jgi:2,4-dienoyl-CoA reductase-like NADH-dependent reductase (Old Yellow Enzyme family)
MKSGRFENLFSPLKIRKKVLKNRIFSTGHMAVMLRDSEPTEQMVAYHGEKAKGGAALTIIEAARVHPSGNSGRPAIRAYDPVCVSSYRRLADTCHEYGCLVFAQLTHPGREMTLGADGTSLVAYAPSAIPNERFHVMPREMPVAMISDVLNGFTIAAGNIRKAGLDGIEIVGSHGYLIGQFLNPNVNRRGDKYGGSQENRLRFLVEAIAAVRQGAGEDMIVGVRLSGDEREHGGIELDEMLDICKSLDELTTLDYFNVTAGTSAGLHGSTHIVPPMAYDAGYTVPLAAAIKARVSKPVFVAGRINQPQIAEEVVKTAQADMCGMTRAIITDPYMPHKAERGEVDDIRACVACNQACIGHMLNATPISCIQSPETGRELEFANIGPANNVKNIMVVGGGPAGMKAAATAAARGHKVTLFESSETLGGQVRLASLLPGRSEFGGVISNLQRELEQSGACVRLNTQVSDNLVKHVAPDTIVIATGATPYEPDLEGSEQAHIVNAWQVLQGKANVGARVVIADWRCDWVGMGLAERLAREGCHVRLAVNGMVAGQTIPQYARDKWLGDLHKLNVEIIPHLRLYGMDAEDVYFQHTLSGEAVIFTGVDTLVTALGHIANTRLEKDLSGFKGAIHVIGDCLAPRTVEEAILEGLRVAVTL